MIIKSSIGSTPVAGAGQTQMVNRCMKIISKGTGTSHNCFVTSRQKSPTQKFK